MFLKIIFSYDLNWCSFKNEKEYVMKKEFMALNNAPKTNQTLIASILPDRLRKDSGPVKEKKK